MNNNVIRNRSGKTSYYKGNKRLRLTGSGLKDRIIARIDTFSFDGTCPNFDPSPKGPIIRKCDEKGMTAAVSCSSDIVTFALGNGITTQQGQSVINPVTTNILWGSIGFELADFDHFSNFDVLFDQYRIEKVQVRFVPLTTSLAPNLTPNISPTLWLAIDQDDNNVLTGGTFDAIRGYDDVARVNAPAGAIVTLNPFVTPAVYSGGTFSGYSTVPGFSTWIDVANPVAYYGIKFGVSQDASSSGFGWQVDARYWISWRRRHG